MYNPLVIFTGAALATLAALMGVTYDKWSSGAAREQAAAPSEQTAPAPALGGRQDLAEPAPPAEPQSASELASISPDESRAPSPESPESKAPLPQPDPPEAAIEPEADDSRPTFDTIRIERDGSALMAGRSLPEHDVTVVLDGRPIGSVRANSDGAWVFIPDEPIPPGDHELTLRMQLPDDQLIESMQSVALLLTGREGEEALVVLNDPDQPSQVLQKPQPAVTEAIAEKLPQRADSEQPAEEATAEPAPAAAPAAGKLASAKLPLTLGTVDYNDRGDIIFSGTADAGASVRLYVDNRAVGEALANAHGAWSYAGKEEISAGTHSLRVDQLRSDGSVSRRIELPFMRAAPQEVAELTQAKAAGAADAPPPENSEETHAPQAAALPESSPVEPAPAAGNEAEGAAPPSRPEETAPESASDDAAAVAAVEPPPAAPSAMEESSADPAALAPSGETQVAAAEQPALSQPQAAASAETSETASASADPAKPRNGRIVIQPGNSLWRISRVIYGRGIEYTVIYDANKDQIRDPHLIYPGQIFATPGVTPPETIDPRSTTPLANTADTPTSQE